MKTKLVIFIVALGLVLSTLWFVKPNNSQQAASHKIIQTSDKPQGGDFTMMSAQGKKSLTDFKGKLVLLYFGYTYCPDICPTNLGNLSVAYNGMSQEQKDKVQILFISVDPERDTPERLQQYVNYFEADMIGLTSSPEYIAQIAKNYGVVYAKVDDPNNGTNYAVDHSAFTYVIDQTGQLKSQLPHATTPDQFIDTVNQYLK